MMLPLPPGTNTVDDGVNRSFAPAAPLFEVGVKDADVEVVVAMAPGLNSVAVVLKPDDDDDAAVVSVDADDDPLPNVNSAAAGFIVRSIGRSFHQPTNQPSNRQPPPRK